MTRMGMDVDQVEQVGRQLKTQAGKIDGLIKEISRVVTGLASVWDGQDAQTFVHDWWPQQRQALVAAQQQIEGLGQSALNNSTDQRQVSSVAGPPGGSGGAGAAVTPVSASPSLATSAAASSAQTQAAANFVSKYQGHAIDYDHAYGAQCFDVFRQYSHDVAGAPDGVNVGSNYASDIWYDYGKPGNDISTYYDQVPAGQGPQPGDVVVYDGGLKDKTTGLYFGHVAVVTGVGQNGAYDVLQQNYSGINPLHPSDPAKVFNLNSNTPQGGLKIIGYLRPKDAHV